MKLSKEQLVDKIVKWESEAGESFTDYFMHSAVKPLSWSFWLLGKGYTEHALNIIQGIEKGETYFDQEDLFEIYPEYTFVEGKDPTYNREAFNKNLDIWAEFLVATESYQKRVNNFFKTN